MTGDNYIKIIGVKFDALEGLRVVVDHNRKNFIEAAEVAEGCNDKDMIFISIPCSCGPLGR